jgi:hypothetical protein
MQQQANPALYQLAPDVVFVLADDASARLLDLSGSFYALSATGAEMLRGVLSNGVEATILDIASQYDLDPSWVRSDLKDLLEKLERSRLVLPPSSRASSSRLRPAVARAAVALMFRLPVRRSPVALLIFARLCFACFGWSDTVAAWGRMTFRDARRGYTDADLDRVDLAVRDAAARLPFVDCKERALSAWFLLCCGGIPATLVVGIHWYPLAGHCWCEVGPRKLTDFEDRCGTYQQVARYGPGPAHTAMENIPTTERVNEAG